ncbi:hypothetical protein [Selenihalanaerobacter shriftii]|uniref:Copper amine oxidase N-terminal domain-containing protein n=1 Tax=Selenihalanaerobacter shriftii TaxID=142842 RepID=A0A1T4L1Z3_9FIRM|nr:hypothetical protein [Selenihalanaerobacter shriftii]SJZ48567.1 hypothetical protein SAMN02745118_00993 [Selenihalanaerobacter shriftii]
MKLIIKFTLCLMIILLMSQIAMAVNVDKTVKGKIVAVNSQQSIFLLENEEGVSQYQIGLDTKLLRNGRSVSLNALRPITAQDFQSALIKLNSQGNVTKVVTEYEVLPIEIIEVNEEESGLKIQVLNSNRLLNINFADEIDLMRNSQQVGFSSLQVGDQGLIILGLNNQIVKIKVKHYEY